MGKQGDDQVSLRTAFAALERNIQPKHLETADEITSMESGCQYQPVAHVHVFDSDGADKLPEPWETWEAVSQDFSDETVVALKATRKGPPSQLQAHAWPTLERQRDAAIVAPAGSGKSLAFLLPSFIRFAKLRNQLPSTTCSSELP